MKVSNYDSMQLRKYADYADCKYTGMKVGSCASVQVYKYRSLQVVHCCTWLFKFVQRCRRLYTVVQPFTLLYKVVKQLYTVVHGCTWLYKAVH